MSESEDSFESADEGESTNLKKNSTSSDSSHSKTNLEAENQKKTESDSKEPNITGCNEEVNKSQDDKNTEIDQKEKPVDERAIQTDSNSSENLAKSIESTDISDKEEEKILTNDECEPLQKNNPLDKLVNKEKSGWGWGNWGSSLLQTATSSVSTFTHSVGEGFTNVLETVESSLGAPDPEELAKSSVSNSEENNDLEIKTDTREKTAEEMITGPQGQAIIHEPTASDLSQPNVVIIEDDSEKDAGWFSTLGVSTLTGVVKNTVQQTSNLVTEKGKGLMHGGIDVLETIGKKTYDVLAEGDHGLKKTVQKAKEKPILSQILREAAAEADAAAKQEEEFIESRKSHFGAQFDDFQGIVQLEALEMLSKQSEAKVHSLESNIDPEQETSIKAAISIVKNIFNEEFEEDDEREDHEFINIVTEKTGVLALNVSPSKLIQAHENIRKYLNDIEANECITLKEVHQKCIQSIAELTAKAVEHFHKIGQLLLMDPKGPVSIYKDKASALASLTMTLCCEVDIVARKFTTSINDVSSKAADAESATPFITNIFLEEQNSRTYTLNGFQLLQPVLLQAILQCSPV